MKTVQKKGMTVAILITTIGVAWLLDVMGVMPRVDWVWPGLLGVAGILVLAFGGLNQITAVMGPLLIIGSILSILRQTDRLSVELQLPIMVICFGCLMMLSILLRLPKPRYLQATDSDAPENDAAPQSRKAG